jgi:DeoR/GlpR family transcriptional regulator of sugar metabolism
MGFAFGSGLTDSNGQESDMKKIMISRSQNIYFLCDHTKIGRVGYAATARPEDIDIMITDEEPDGKTREGLSSLGIDIMLAK